MAITYTASAADGQPVSYRDRKRWAWLLSVVWPLIPFTGLAAHHASGLEIALVLPLLISYGLMPLLEAGVNLVGACCGSTPEHIRAFRKVMDEFLESKATEPNGGQHESQTL